MSSLMPDISLKPDAARKPTPYLDPLVGLVLKQF